MEQGDILECKIDVKYGFEDDEWKTLVFAGVVEYEATWCTYWIRDSKGKLHPVLGYVDSVEIVGNIHDNPERVGREQSGESGQEE